MKMLATVEKTIADNGLIARGETVLVGVSGGPDSTALLHCLHLLQDKLGFKLAVCHLNHHIRGRESDGDAKFARDLAARYGTPFYTGSVRVMEKRKSRGGSIEEVAREERYKFFRRTAAKCGASKIALGHNADDNVETFFFNLLRGTGIKGLAGIPVSRPEGDFVIIRPLIRVPKSDIMKYLKSQGLSYHTDSTNRDISYTRNRIRLRLLPYLRKNYSPNVGVLVQNTSGYLRQCADFIQDRVNEIAVKHVEEIEGGFAIALKDYLMVHPGLRDILMKDLFEKYFGFNANRETLAHLRSLAEKKGKYKIALANGLTGFLEYGNLIFQKKPVKKSAPASREIPIPSNLLLPDWNISIETSLIKPENLPEGFRFAKREPMGAIWQRVFAEGEAVEITEYLDADSLKCDTLLIRSRKPGDKYRPIGNAGTRTLKKLLIDEKVPVSHRERVPVIAASGRIVYVPGYRIAEAVRITTETRNVMKLNIRIFAL